MASFSFFDYLWFCLNKINTFINYLVGTFIGYKRDGEFKKEDPLKPDTEMDPVQSRILLPK